MAATKTANRLRFRIEIMAKRKRTEIPEPDQGSRQVQDQPRSARSPRKCKINPDVQDHRGILGQGRMCPEPVSTYLVEVISGSPIGPRTCSFWVDMPISAPKPNSPPSVKRVEAFTVMTAA